MNRYTLISCVDYQAKGACSILIFLYVYVLFHPLDHFDVRVSFDCVWIKQRRRKGACERIMQREREREVKLFIEESTALKLTSSKNLKIM